MSPADQPDQADGGATKSADRVDRDVVDAIRALGNRQRLEILLALAEGEPEPGSRWGTKSFTELYGAVDVDSSSQFAYHLQQLVGRFVAEESDGYRLTYSGDKLVRTVRSGIYERTETFGDETVPGTCIFCETDTLVATLEDDLFVVRCTGCDTPLVTDVLPRSQTRNRTPSEIVESVGCRLWSSFGKLRGGVCPECYGRVETELDVHERGGKTLYTLASTCHECGFAVGVPAEVAAALHPAVTSAFWNQGLAPRETPIWEFFEYVVSDAIVTDVVSREPLELAFEITLGDESLRLHMDDELNVSPVENDTK